MRSSSVRCVLAAALLSCVWTGLALGEDYDPSRLVPTERPPLDLSFTDAKRQRDLPVLIYLPKEEQPAPVVLFSHGLGGTRRTSTYLGDHWSARGYVVVFLQHPGSDDSVWRGQRPGEGAVALRGAANLENFLLRAGDVSAVLDQLTRWNAETGHALQGKLDLEHVGMSGHSFGAITTQAVSGQRAPRGRSMTEPRITAAVMMSPSPPRRGVEPEEAFGSVQIPWMLLTGTEDSSPIGESDPANRLKVFPALPAGSKYQLVLDGARHLAFTDRILRSEQVPRNPLHHPEILAVTTAFWDAYLKRDAAAREWLDSDRVRTVLEPADQWSRK